MLIPGVSDMMADNARRYCRSLFVIPLQTPRTMSAGLTPASTPKLSITGAVSSIVLAISQSARSRG